MKLSKNHRWHHFPDGFIFVDKLTEIVDGETATISCSDDGTLRMLVTFDVDLAPEDVDHANRELLDRAQVRGVYLREGKGEGACRD